MRRFWNKEKHKFYGELPRSPVVFAACDSHYFGVHAEPLISSCDKIGKDVHIHICNPYKYDIDKCVLLQNGVKNINVTFTFNEIDTGKAGFKNNEQWRTYYACLRFIYLPQILHNATRVLTVDIDCFFMNDFEWPKHPIGYFPCESFPGTVGWEAEGTKVLAGAVYFDNRAQSVANRLSHNISNANVEDYRWFLDQIVLADVMKSIEPSAKHHFDYDFLDHEFREGTVIWTGRGPRKDNNETYKTARRKFYDILNQYKQYDRIILAPRLDLPWKNDGLCFRGMVNEPIREKWGRFINEILASEKNSKVIWSSRWMFLPDIVWSFKKHAEVFVPHMRRWQFDVRDDLYDVKFYMQTVFDDIFTIDKEGWGGDFSFKETFDPKTEDYSDSHFNELAERTKSGVTKFGQNRFGVEKHRFDALLNEIRPKKYIFFPLQIPHDETILYDVVESEKCIVRALCEWASTSDVPMLVFKVHPVNGNSLNEISEMIKRYKNTMVVGEHHIKDLIENAEATYVINSGVGQEAMLLDSPVVNFGNCDYEGATIKGDLYYPHGTWLRVQEDDHEERKKIYRRWFDWYITKATRRLEKKA